MTGPILGTLLGGNELCKEGLIITATALTWTEPFYLACQAWKTLLWEKSHLSAGKTSFLALCQCSLTLVKGEHISKIILFKKKERNLWFLQLPLLLLVPFLVVLMSCGTK